MKRILAVFLMLIVFTNFLVASSWWEMAKNYGEKKFKEYLQQQFDKKLEKLGVTQSIPVESCLQALDHIVNGEFKEAVQVVKGELLNKFVELVFSDFAPLINVAWEFAKYSFTSVQEWARELDKKRFIDKFLKPEVESWRTSQKVPPWDTVKSKFDLWFQDNWENLAKLEFYSQKDAWRKQLQTDMLWRLKKIYYKWYAMYEKRRLAQKAAKEILENYKAKVEEEARTLLKIAEKLNLAGEAVNLQNIDRYLKDRKYRYKVNKMAALNEKIVHAGLKKKIDWNQYQVLERRIAEISEKEIFQAALFLKTTGFGLNWVKVVKFCLHPQFQNLVKGLVKKNRLEFIPLTKKEKSDLLEAQKKTRMKISSFLTENLPYLLNNQEIEGQKLNEVAEVAEKSRKPVADLLQFKAKINEKYNALLSQQITYGEYRSYVNNVLKVAEKLLREGLIGSPDEPSQVKQYDYQKLKDFIQEKERELARERESQKKELWSFQEKINNLGIYDEGRELDRKIEEIQKKRFVLFASDLVNEKNNLAKQVFGKGEFTRRLATYREQKKLMAKYLTLVENLNPGSKIALFTIYEEKLDRLYNEYLEALRKNFLAASMVHLEIRFEDAKKYLRKIKSKLRILNKILANGYTCLSLLNDLISYVTVEKSKNEMLLFLINLQKKEWQATGEKFLAEAEAGRLDAETYQNIRDCKLLVGKLENEGINKDIWQYSGGYPRKYTLQEHLKKLAEIERSKLKKIENIKQLVTSGAIDKLAEKIKAMQKAFKNSVDSIEIWRYDVKKEAEEHRKRFYGWLDTPKGLKEFVKNQESIFNIYKKYCELAKKIDANLKKKLRKQMDFLEKNVSNLSVASRWQKISYKLTKFLEYLPQMVPYKLDISPQAYLQKIDVLSKKWAKLNSPLRILEVKFNGETILNGARKTIYAVEDQGVKYSLEGKVGGDEKIVYLFVNGKKKQLQLNKGFFRYDMAFPKKGYYKMELKKYPDGVSYFTFYVNYHYFPQDYFSSFLSQLAADFNKRNFSQVLSYFKRGENNLELLRKKLNEVANSQDVYRLKFLTSKLLGIEEVIGYYFLRGRVEAAWELFQAGKAIKKGMGVFYIDEDGKNKLSSKIYRIDGDNPFLFLQVKENRQRSGNKGLIKGHCRISHAGNAQNYSFDFATQKYGNRELDIACGYVNPKAKGYDKPYFGCGQLIDLGPKSLDAIKEAPATGYSGIYDGVRAIPGHVYCLETRGGKYVKLKVTSAGGEGVNAFIEFDWVYQPNGSRKFE